MHVMPWVYGRGQINCILPPVGFIIITHFNEVATDIKTRSLSVMFHRGSAETASRWLRRERLERGSGTHLQSPQAGLGWIEGANQERVKTNRA